MRSLLLSLLGVGSVGLHALGVPPVVAWPPTLVAVGLAIALYSASRPPDWALLGSLAVISICLSVAVMDGLLRGLFGERLHFRPHDRFVGRWPADPDLYRYQRHVRYRGEEYGDLAAMSGRPELRVLRPTVFETDGRGFRNVPGTDAEPLDAIILSDSFGVGVGTTQDETWAQGLRERGYPTYSLSIPGSPWRALLNLKAELDTLPVHPGTWVLWTFFVGNDLDERFRSRLEPLGYTGLRRAWSAFLTWRRRSPLRDLVDRLRGGKEPLVAERALPSGDPMLFYTPYVERATRSADEVRAHRNWKAYLRVLEEMKRFTAERNVRLAIVIVPTKSQTYPWVLHGGEPDPTEAQRPRGTNAAVLELCREVAVRCLDLTPDFVAAAAAGVLLWWRDDTHWNAAGHALAARIVDEQLTGAREADPGATPSDSSS